jgi:transposase
MPVIKQATNNSRKTTQSPASLELENRRLKYELKQEKSARRKIEVRHAALEERFKRLEERLETVEADNRRLRESRNKNEEFLQNEIRKLQKEVIDRDEKLEAANKQLVWLRTNQFGKKSEQGKGKPNEPSPVASESNEDEENNSVRRNRGQQPGSKGHGRSDQTDIDTKIEYLDIPGCACGKCGKPYRLMPKTEASPLTEFEISLVRTIFQRCMYVSQCPCEGRKIVVAPPPPKIYPRTEIGNSLWVRLLVQKFLHGMPQNRILKELSLFGLSLPAGTVTGGCKIINDLLNPLVEELINHCRGADFWNADETTWRVFGDSKQRWWFWLVASDDAVVYLLDPSRSKKVPTDFFAGSSGILLTDRLASYKALQESIRKAWCWVHQRRDILNVFKGIPQLKPWAKGWLQDIATLFVLNHKRFCLWQQDQTSGKQWEQAVVALELHVQKLQERFEKEIKRPNLHKQQSKILRSMKNHWAGLTIFLEDPRIPLDNNRAERLLRNAVILRKNSYGSGASWAGHMTAKVFSIFQTWLINGLDPQALLLDYFNECSKTPGKPPPDVSQFLPWKMSSERKKKYALPDSYRRPG